MDRGTPEEAEVLETSVQVDEGVRRAQLIEVDAGTLAWAEAKLDTARPAVARALGVSLDGREGAGFLRYGPGGLYRRHVDWARSSVFPGAAVRLVTVVVFLGTARDDPGGDFVGGTLRLFPSDGQPPVDIVPTRGTLVAFSASTPHEVLEVRRGVRDTIVDWYCDRGV
jgi:predicted 2-oxoglutarate/Fe(II)-dependent dioxygenase YbiX